MSLSTKTPLHGDGVLLIWGSIDTATVNEEALNDWWTNQHLPERIQLPGFIRARRYCGSSSADETRTYLACYEVSKLEHLESESYMNALNLPTPETQLFMPALARMNRSACSVLCSKARMGVNFAGGLIGNWMASIVFSPPDPEKETEDDFIRRITDCFYLRTFSCSSVLSFNLVHQDNKTTQLGSQSQSYLGVQFDLQGSTSSGAERKYIALIEFAIPATTNPPAVQQAVESFICQIRPFGATGINWEAYQLICSMDKNALQTA